MEVNLTIASLILVVTVSTLVSVLYSVRVIRNRSDHLRWALLGLLLSLALTNAPPMMAYLGHPLPLWYGQLSRVAAAAILIWTVWPLMRDSYEELRYYVLYTVVKRNRKSPQE